MSRMNLFSTMFLCSLLAGVSGWAGEVAAETPYTAYEAFDLANKDRIAEGLPALVWDDTLAQAALAKASDMGADGYFAHTAPDGTTPWNFFDLVGYRYRFAGENLAIHFTDALAEETAWMASPKHRENILSSKYRETGIAVREIPWEGRTTIVAVQLFGTRLGEEMAVVESASSQTISMTTDKAEPSLMEPEKEETTIPVSSVVVPDSSFDSTFPIGVVLGIFALVEVFATVLAVRVLARNRRDRFLAFS